MREEENRLQKEQNESQWEMLVQLLGQNRARSDQNFSRSNVDD